MRKLGALLAIASLLSGGGSLAQIDPDLDGVGIYWDEAATIYCHEVPPFSPTVLFLVLTNPSAAGGVGYMECKLGFDSNQVQILGTVFPGGGINICDPFPNICAGYHPPLPWAPTITLMSLQIFPLTAECSWLYLEPYDNAAIPGQMAYADGDDPGNLIPMYPSTGDFAYPVFGANCFCPPPIDVVDSSWGAVKTIYR
jgi:hypothetical protein